MSSVIGVTVGGLAVVVVAGCAVDKSVSPTEEAMRLADRANPMIALLEQGQPVFGLYAPCARRRGGASSQVVDVKTPAQLADGTTAYERSDYVFVSSMEGGVERELPAFIERISAMQATGATAETHPFVVKMAKISDDPHAVAHIGQQLNAV